MIKNIYFGQYRHKESFVHGLDPRLKVVYVFVLSILVFTLKNRYELLFFSLFMLFILLISKIELRSLARNLRSFYMMFAFIILMYVIFSRSQLLLGFLAVWRFLMLITMSSVLTFTTKISDLVAAIERLAKPLRAVNVKPRNAAVMISITIRFVPVMFVNLERLRESMLSRLANFRKIKNISLIVVLLLERMLKSASNLSDAMQSRLYNENVESQKEMRLKSNDYFSAAIVAVLVLIIY